MANKKVPVVNEIGEVGLVDREVAQQGLAAGNLRNPSAEEYKDYALQRDYGGVAGKILAGGIGLADTASFHTAKPAIAGVLKATLGEGDARQFISDVDKATKANPITSGTADLGGYAAQAMLLGPTGGYSALSNLTKAGFAKAGATGAISKAIAGSIGMGLETGAMGATRELGKELTEEMLGDHNFNAETIISSAGHNFLLGAALGGVTGVAGIGARKGLEATKDLLMRGKPLAERMESMADDLFANSLNMKLKQTRGVEATYKGGVKQFSRDAQEALTKEASILEGRAVKLEELSIPKSQEVIESGFGRIKNNVKGVMDEMVAAEPQSTIASRMDMADKLNEARTSLLEGLAADPTPLARGKENIVNGFFDHMLARPGVTKKPIGIEELWEGRKFADKAWFPSKIGPPPPESIYGDIRHKLEDMIVAKGEELSLTTGKDLAGKWAGAKQEFQLWKGLSDASKEMQKRNVSNNMVSLTGKIASAAGGVVGGMIGGLPGAGVGAMLAMAGSKYLRDKVPYMAAGALKRASAAVRAREAIMHTDRAIETSVDSLFSGGAVKRFVVAPAIEMFGADRMKRNDNVNKVIEHFSDTNRNLANAQQSVEHIKHDLPGTAGALAAKQMQVMSYISQHAPRPASSNASIMPWMDYKLYNDEDIATYAKKIRAAVDPMTILHDAKQGFVSPEAVAVVKDLYPEMYQKMVQRAMQAMLPPTGKGKKKGPQASLSQSVQLSILFGINYPLTDPVYLQQIHPAQPASPDGPQGQAKAPARNSGSAAGTMAESVGSPTEKLGDEL